MPRIKFRQKGLQKKFLKNILNQINSPSLRDLSKRINVNYSTLKNYYSEKRLMPKELFEDLINLSKNSPKTIELKDNWGQVKGGKRTKKKNGPIKN